MIFSRAGNHSKLKLRTITREVNFDISSVNLGSPKVPVERTEVGVNKLFSPKQNFSSGAKRK